MRLVIFCFFDIVGQLDNSDRYLLDELRGVSDKLVIAINGKINKDGYQYINQISDYIIIRDNKGYDAGAYADVIVQLAEEMSSYDEVVLCNNTFYGPFIELSNIFEKMASKNVDIWGINRIEYERLSYVESYFLVFRSTVLKTKALVNFFAAYRQKNIDDILDVYAFFELGIYIYMKKRGFKISSYRFCNNLHTYKDADQCLMKCGLPIVKKKSFSDRYFNNERQLKILQYIYKNYGKEMLENIIENVHRLYKLNYKIDDIISKDNRTFYQQSRLALGGVVSDEEILAFIRNKEKIYIWGTGVYARKIWFAYSEELTAFSGFVVTDNKYKKDNFLYGYPVFCFDEIEDCSNIILGLDKENTQTILKMKLSRVSVLNIWKNDNYLIDDKDLLK